MSEAKPSPVAPAPEPNDSAPPPPGSSSPRPDPVPPPPPPAGAVTVAPAAAPRPTAAGGAPDCRSFSQLLAGTMSSPAASPRASAPPILAVPIVAVPCFLAPAALLESPSFRGQFAMTHQAVLATVTAQAQMQMQAAQPSSVSQVLTCSFPPPVLTAISPVPLQQRPPDNREDNSSTPEVKQLPVIDQKSHSAQIVAKTKPEEDGYNWRKYGQKQVKSSDNSRSYYKCTTVDCSAKKKVERCPDGRIVEVTHRGQHNHDPPQQTRFSRERASRSGGLVGEDGLHITYTESNELDTSISKKEQSSGHGNPGQQLFCSSDCEGDAGVKAEDLGDEPDSKRRITESIVPYSVPILKTFREPRIVVQAASDIGRVSDGYRWRKYGQKIVKGNPNPRSYYRCTHNGCPVRKHVEKASDDAKAIVITYEGKHNHDLPGPKSSCDPPASPLPVAAASTTTPSEPLQSSDAVLEKKPATELPTSVDGKSTGAKVSTSELGGEKALESAQALLSIGCNSSTGDNEGGQGLESTKYPILKEKPAAVPVHNS